MINMEETFGGEYHFLDTSYKFKNPIFFDGHEYYDLDEPLEKAKLDNIDEWEDNRLNILNNLNLQKFNKNSDLKQRLLDTEDNKLYIEHDNNYLGEVLTKCRKMFKEEEVVSHKEEVVSYKEEIVSHKEETSNKHKFNILDKLGGGDDNEFIIQLKENLSRLDFTLLSNKYWDNINNVEKIYNARCSILDTLEMRGFNIDSIYLSNNVNLHVLIDKFLNEEEYLLVNGLDFFIQKNDDLSEISINNNEKVFVKFLYPLKKPNYDKLIKYYKCQYDIEENDSLIIIICNNNITPDIFQNYDKDNIYIFHYERIQVNLLRHSFVPEHSICNKSQIKQICKDYRTTKSKFPYINRNDPICKLLNGKEGQVIKIKRKSLSNVTIDAYRLVVMIEYNERDLEIMFNNIDKGLAIKKEKVIKEKVMKEKLIKEEPVEPEKAKEPIEQLSQPIEIPIKPKKKNDTSIITYGNLNNKLGTRQDDIKKLIKGTSNGIMIRLDDNIPQKWKKTEDIYESYIIKINQGVQNLANDIITNIRMESKNMADINDEYNGTIEDFHQEDTEFLSNFHLCEIIYEGIKYPSVEHAFQAAKSKDPDERIRISKISKPDGAKSAGKKVKLRDDWEKVKVDIMKNLLLIKFKNSELRDKLISTNDKELIEGNTWRDTFWGVYRGKGKNILGKLLMSVRKGFMNNINHIEILLERINKEYKLDYSGINIEYYENIDNEGKKLMGDKDRYEKIIVNVGREIPMEFQWFRYSKSSNDYVKEGNPIHITLNDGDILLFSNKSVGNDCDRKSVLSVRHSIGKKFLDTI